MCRSDERDHAHRVSKGEDFFFISFAFINKVDEEVNGFDFFIISEVDDGNADFFFESIIGGILCTHVTHV